jgi:phage baseplate assembly protein gpV
MTIKQAIAKLSALVLISGFLAVVPQSALADGGVSASSAPSQSPSLSAFAFEPIGATVSVSSITTNSAVASWTLPDEAEITRVEMAHYNYTTSQWTSLPASTSKSGSVNLTGLTAGTGYAFRTNTFYASGVAKLGDIQFETMTTSSSDLQLPVLVPSSVSISATTVAPGGQLTGQFRVTDDIGCCSWARIDMRTATPFENRDQARIWTAVTPRQTSGNATDGVYSAAVTVPSNTPAGSYMLYGQAIDNFGRYTHLVVLGTFEVRAAADVQLPVLVPSSVSISATTVAPGGQVTGQFRVTDDIGCCSWARIDMRTATPFADRDRARIWVMATPRQTSGNATDGVYSAAVTVPSNTPAGSYMLYGQAIDNFGRYTHLVVLGTFEVRVAATNTAPTLSVSDVRSRSATATWSVPNDTPTRSISLEIQEVQVGSWANVSLPTSNTKAGSVDLTVKPGTAYRLRVVATYTDGTSKTEVANFTTPALTPPPTPSIRIDNSDPEVAVVTWSYSFSNLEKFVISIREAGGSESPVDLSASARSHRFSGLKPNSQFVVTLQAVANTGATASTNVTLLTPVKQLIDPARPTITEIVAAQSSAVLAFAQESLRGADPVQRWDIQVRLSGESSWATVSRIQNDGRSSRTVTIGDLSAGRTYQARVVARGEGGTSSISSIRDFETSVGIATPDSLSSRDVTWNSAVLTWFQATDGPATVPSRYEVELTEGTSESWRTVKTLSSSDRRPTTTISGLKSGTEYLWRVTAVSKSGVKEVSYVESFSTPSSMRSPSNLSVSDVGDNWARVTWSYIANQAFKPVATFEIRVSQNQGATWTTLVSNIPRTARAVRIEDLAPETDYDVRIVARSSDGEEAYDALTIVTNQKLEEITEVTVSLISARSVTIKWLLPSVALGGQEIDSVSVQIRSGNRWVTRVRNAEPDQLEAKLTNLEPGTRYTYRVVSVGEDGSRDFSEPKRFRTR